MTDTKPPAPFAARGVLSIAGVVAVAHVVAAVLGGDYWFDEVYMLAIGRHHLDWGSADQPPLTPALAAVADAVWPDSILLLRLSCIVATTGAVVVAALIAREMGCDRRAQVFVAAAQGTAFWAALAGHWLTPYTLEPVQWLLLLWLLVRWIRLRDDRLLLALGVVTGIAAMTKFQVLLVVGVLLAAIAVCGPRALLRRPATWAAAGIAALIASPTLWWQAVHGWPQLKMSAVVAEEAGPLYGGRSGIAVQLLLSAGVAMVVLAGYGLWRLLRDRELREYRFLAVTFVVLYVVFVVTGGRPYYLGGFYAALAAAGALGLQGRREAGRTRWRRTAWPAFAISAAVAVGALVLGVMLTRSGVDEQIAARTAQAYQRLPAEQRDRTAVVGESYIVAAYLDGHSTAYGLPRAYSTTRSYGFFPPPPDGTDRVLFVGSDPAKWRPYFETTTQVGEVSGEMKAWLLSDRRAGWGEIWPALQTLRVT